MITIIKSRERVTRIFAVGKRMALGVDKNR